MPNGSQWNCYVLPTGPYLGDYNLLGSVAIHRTDASRTSVQSQADDPLAFGRIGGTKSHFQLKAWLVKFGE
jgi:hypothetical protein